MAVNDVYEVVHDINVENQRTTMTLHFLEKIASTKPIPALSLANSLETNWEAFGKQCMTAAAQLTSIYARRLLPTAGVPGQRLVSTVNGTGTRSADALPPQVATVISLYSATATRRGRGRIFMGAMAEEDQDAGQLTAAQIVRVQDFVEDLITGGVVGIDGDAGNWVLCVYSPADAAGREVIYSLVRSNVTTLRTRRAIYGPGG